MRQRRNALIVLAAMVFLLFGILFSQTAFNLTFLRPASTQETLIFAGLSALVFLLFVALSFMLMRNLLKLYGETKLGVLGSRFRTKMVTGALLLSLTPATFLFLFAYVLMNHSIGQWFSRPVELLRNDSEQIADLLQNYVVANASAEAKEIAQSPEAQQAYQTKNFTPLVDEMRRHSVTLEGGFAIALLDGDAVAGFHAPEPWPEMRQRMHTHERTGTTLQTISTANGREYLVAQAPVADHGAIITALPVPEKFFDTLAQIEASQQRYYELGNARRQVRQFYMMLLSVITAAVLFAATWLSMFMSRLVTRPVSALAEATHEISQGNLTYRIHYETADELGQLIQRFNHMAAEIEAKSLQVENSRIDLERANEALEQRRRQIETILESIPTGVLSLDAAGRVALSNRAFLRMFPSLAPSAFSASSYGTKNILAPGMSIEQVFDPATAEQLRHLMRRAQRMGTAAAQLEMMQGSSPVNLAVTAAAIDLSGTHLGHVLVFEDFSDLLKAQKQAAWREVARRVAHEIKNPLTPIALSAERIQRYLDRGAVQGDAPSIEALRGCAESIAANVETVRTLVNEFSAMAQFPAARPVATDVNALVREALAMFDGRLSGIRVNTDLAPELPKAQADPEAMKRVIANLVDNAAEALSTQQSLVKEIDISTAAVDGRDAIEISVADSGPGVTAQMRERLFLPYFSTKNRGTGLGLAIVSKIVQEHRGSVRVEENTPAGARFIVEIPTATNESVEPTMNGAAS